MEKNIFIIDRLSLKGDGVGHLKSNTGDRGKVAFIPYTLPGEEVSARTLFDKKDYSRHIPVKILKPSRLRRKAPCPFFFNPEKASLWCGGCDFQHLDHEAQLSAKGMLVQETLERIGGFKNPPMKNILHAAGEFRYRNKVQVPVGGDVKNIQTGFFHPDSHTLVPFDDCLIQPDVLVRVLGVIRKLASALKWVPYDEDRHRGWLRHILLRSNNNGQVLVALITKDSSSPGR
jgi:23S rRNA (uracil1939-C5)-methyltransferase